MSEWEKRLNMKPLLEYGKYYHIYNRGNNYENLFVEKQDYEHFLKLLEVYIHSVADIYVWCLMKNHFHIAVRVKDETEIGYLNANNVKAEDPEIKWKTYLKPKPDKIFNKKPNPTQQFKHLFKAYSRWFNIRHQRRGSLFEKNYERKEISNDTYFSRLILYIHNNPVHHGFVDDFIEYPWTSYETIISEKPTKLKKHEVIYYFDDLENFKYLHKRFDPENDERFND